jgi:hypothetical protein
MDNTGGRSNFTPSSGTYGTLCGGEWMVWLRSRQSLIGL